MVYERQEKLKMKKKSSVSLILAAVLLFSAGLAAGSLIRSPQAPPAASVDPCLTDGITDPPVPENIPVTAGTTRNMLRPGYWTTGRQDRLLFTAEEIADFNENNPLYVLYYSPEKGRSVKLYMYDLPETLDGYIVKTLIAPQKAKDFTSGGKTAYVNGKASDAAYWNGLVKNCAAGSIPGTVDPVYAVSVRRTVSYVLPSDDFVSGEPDEKYINDMVSAEVMPFTGVVILHESADKEWSFILNGTVCGWTRTEDLCICSDKDQWLAAARPESFITVTGCEIVMDETAVPTASSGMVLPMGTKLRLASGSTTAVSGRSALGCYTVEIPFRRDDGTLGFEQALVPVSEDVCEGYPAMTSSSVIEQAFKFLGRVYGWGGTLSSNDCSGFIRQVYSCYGFELPRNSLAIATLTDLGRSDCSEMTLPRKRQVIKNMPAGQLLYMDGHLMLYLGMDGDKPYVISSCASYIDPQSKEMVDANCVFVSGLDLLRKNGKTWLESISYFQDRDY